MEQDKPKVFKLGIAMAGAVSAGAYTAGVMDYLLETLEKWEIAKSKNRRLGSDHPDYDASVPMHDVVIEVLGGASAGGMTAAITTLALFEPIRPVNAENPEGLGNKLYEAWVHLNDRADSEATLDQMLRTDDIELYSSVPALLNSKPIDAIADRAAVFDQLRDKMPPYFSENLEVILTLTSLRGVPIAVSFYDEVKARQRGLEDHRDQPFHQMFMHKGVAHFSLGDKDMYKPHSISFDPKNREHQQILLECAKATGAFPLGLQARLLNQIKPGYIKAMVYRLLGLDRFMEERGADLPGIDIPLEGKTFDFVAVDGGTINNEPFDEITRSMEDKAERERFSYAIIMIDPFPNFQKSLEEKIDPSIIEHWTRLLPGLLGAIRDQAMVKESDLLRALSSDHTRRMIFPKQPNEPYPIACGSLEGFGGFFSPEFREHDFALGRKNCQSFIRRYFNVPVEKAKEFLIFSDWEQDDKDPRHHRFCIYNPDTQGLYYPIIPDMDIENLRAGKVNNILPFPDKPKLAPQDLKKLIPKIQHRIHQILLHPLPPKKEGQAPEVEKAEQDRVEAWMIHFFGPVARRNGKPGFFSRFFWWGWKVFIAKLVAKSLTKTTMRIILSDFNERSLLDNHL